MREFSGHDGSRNEILQLKILMGSKVKSLRIELVVKVKLSTIRILLTLKLPLVQYSVITHIFGGSVQAPINAQILS